MSKEAVEWLENQPISVNWARSMYRQLGDDDAIIPTYLYNFKKDHESRHDYRPGTEAHLRAMEQGKSYWCMFCCDPDSELIELDYSDVE